ncbi:MAG: hypothetical protein HC846_07835 [Blastocatellia bacterium]|nr:hypothetical protein [Blastocatellia bacterium]
MQRQKIIPVWGWAKPNETVNVSLANQTKTIQTDANGKWKVELAPMEAGGPFELKVSASSGNVIVKDVLIGEVWLCSGQSNMEWTVKQADNFKQERKDSNYPQIRHFYVSHDVQIEPQSDLNAGEWKVGSSETVGDFTAVGFFLPVRFIKKQKFRLVWFIHLGAVHRLKAGLAKKGCSLRMNSKITDKICRKIGLKPMRCTKRKLNKPHLAMAMQIRL